ncbi:hypothetical protein JCM21900_002571 [Sporobolomyces salmonicolor]
MSSSSSEPQSTLDLASTFILDQLDRHRRAWAVEHSGKNAPALVVGVQGPQGSGKSHLASLLPTSPSLAHLRIASLSLDDLYLPHHVLTTLASAHPTNALLHGRGQAGTHDVPLGLSVLEALKSAQEQEVVHLPVFEKSLHAGEGDRLPASQWVGVEAPLDVVVFEGWMTGFRALPPQELSRVYALARAEPAKAAEELGLDYGEPFLLQHKEADLLEVNQALGCGLAGDGGEEGAGYERLWGMVDCLVQLRPERMGFVWEWRLEQEHNMKAKNGGVGMSDEQVKTFIARYMPGYELFLRGIEAPHSTWKGKGLRVKIGRRREVVGVERF